MEKKELDELNLTVNQLIKTENPIGKIEILEKTKNFIQEFDRNSKWRMFYSRAKTKEKLVIASIFAIGEAPIVFRGMGKKAFDSEKFKKLIANLEKIECFYSSLGGIFGYHYAILKLINEDKDNSQNKRSFFKPIGIDLSIPGKSLNKWIREGIENLSQLAEIYPVGGAGDRLGLTDESTGEPRPAAELPFCGYTLLESLIRDLQAKEYLYYKLIGEQILTPIAMMTSEEKNNHELIRHICRKNFWFGRGENSFFLFKQPLVPVVTIEGHWSLFDTLELSLKPGGHGVIWGLARDLGVFEWLFEKNREKALVRQINNPIAGTDTGILAFTGIGCSQNKTFGFSCCPRLLNTAEGTIVLVCSKTDKTFEYSLSNIEYTEFSKMHLKDIPENPGEDYSKFPANTNILFVNMRQIEQVIAKNPIPGMIVNFKNTFPYIDKDGVRSQVKAGRLESTMQSISDSIKESSDHVLSEEEHLEAKIYMTYNERRKTLSVTKNSCNESKSILETPQRCFYEILQNNVELFSKFCKMDIPKLSCETDYIQQGPNLILLFHPALGPLFSIISQKMRGGMMVEGCELQLEITEIDIENLNLEGSLIVESKNPLGSSNPGGRMRYSEISGKCELKNVTVKNKGIDREKENHYWKNHIQRKERLKIILEGSAEFSAENITFTGDHTIVVPDGFHYAAYQKNGKIEFRKEPIDAPTWWWDYSFDQDDAIKLKKINNSPYAFSK